MPPQRICGAEKQVRNKLSNGPRRAQANEKWGRYTFLGYAPKLEITCKDGVMKAGNLTIRTENPSDYLRQILADYMHAYTAVNHLGLWMRNQ